MKVTKEKSREYNGKEYFKYKLIIPKKILDEANISEKDKLEAKSSKDKIIIKKKVNTSN